MNNYYLTIMISAECKGDAEEMINDYLGNETDVEVITTESVEEYSSRLNEAVDNEIAIKERLRQETKEPKKKEVKK